MPFGPASTLLHVGAAAERLDRHHLQQLLDFARQLAETVDKFGGKTFDVAFVLDFRQPPIKRQAHREIGDIILRNEQRPRRW